MPRFRRKRHAVRYQACGLEEHVYLHPHSALHRAAPELVLYLQLLRTDKRAYMAGLTTVEVGGWAVGWVLGTIAWAMPHDTWQSVCLCAQRRPQHRRAAQPHCLGQ